MTTVTVFTQSVHGPRWANDGLGSLLGLLLLFTFTVITTA